ncbi:LamG-like jellyroll fold domain-containing protein [Nonomuraea sp. NPDC050556]|uniref:LamG-like jellyroll fold domain-containing protein n=1 Tax=Nonomuraea sp. NPDC050556 TaxID=3364369 RepID=UPI003793AF41
MRRDALLPFSWRKSLGAALSVLMVSGALSLGETPAAVAAVSLQATAGLAAPTGDVPQTPQQQLGSARPLAPLVGSAATDTSAKPGTPHADAPTPKGALPLEDSPSTESDEPGVSRMMAAASVGYCSSFSSYSGGSYSSGAQVVLNKYVYRANTSVPSGQAPPDAQYTTTSGGMVEWHYYWGNVGPCDDDTPPPTTQYPPSLTDVFPLSGMLVGTRTPMLGAEAVSNMGDYGIDFSFKICTDQALSAGCVTSGWLTSGSGTWRVPASKALAWSKQYWWQVTARDASNSLTTDWSGTLTTGVRQPSIGSNFSTPGPDGQEFQPSTGNYSAAVTDATVATVGPPLAVSRSYNSLDPRRTSMFGAGWSTRWDMKITPEGVVGGASPTSLLVTNPDGRQVRFAANGGTTGTFQPPPGMYATLAETRDVAGGPLTGWKLMDKSATTYLFDAQGRLTKITDQRGRSQSLDYGTDGKLAKVTSIGGRSLSFAWTGSHVTQVSTDPVDGAPLTWTYAYNGDKLTSACSPAQAPNCTTYEYATGSQYASTVLNSDPLGYWRLGEQTGTDAQDAAGGAGLARLNSVTLKQPGAVSGSTDTSAQFTGSSSVTLPDAAIAQLGDAASIEAWFKTTKPGVIAAISPNSTTAQTAAPARTALYIGSDGLLRGQFRPRTDTAAIAPIASTGVVTDGQWHHVALTLGGGTQQLFLDGQPVGTATGTSVSGWPITAQVGNGLLEGGGKRGWPGGPVTTAELPFVGQLDEVAVYDKPLTPQEIATHVAARAVAPHLMSKIALPSGRVWMQTTYDAGNDRVKTHTDANGGAWQVGPPALNGKGGVSTVKVTDPANGTISYDYDTWRGYRLLSRTDQLTKKTTYDYDTGGFVAKVTDPNTNTVQRTYDKRGNVLTTTTCRAAGNCQTVRNEYYLNTGDDFDQRNDRITKVRDARSANATDNTYATTFEYNSFGEPTKRTSPATTGFASGRSESVSYTDGSEPATGGGSTPAGLPKTQTDANGNAWTYAYTATGDLAGQTSPAGLRAKLDYDVLGRLSAKTEISAANPDGVKSTFTYDPLGRLLTQTAPGVKNEVTGATHTARTTFTYDPDGYKLTQAASDLTGGDPERKTTYTYDPFGHAESVTDPEGAVIRQAWNSLGLPSHATDARGTILTLGYSARGELISTTLKGWTASPVNPQPAKDIVLESRSYDPAGRLASQVDAMGRKTTFTYFGDNLLSQKIADDVKLNGATSTKDVVLEAHTYDAAGKHTKLVTGGGITTTDFVYDPAGMLTSQTADPAGVKRTTAFTYDAAGNTLKSTRTGAGSAKSEITEFVYNKANQVTRKTVENGAQDLVSTMTYDERGLLTETTDPRGNADGAAAVDYTTTLRYDLLGRLVETTAPPVKIDKLGQSSTSRPSIRVGYNTLGEQTHSVDAEGRTVVTTFDKAGRQVRTTAPVYTPPGGTAITPTTTNEYDPAGKIVRATDPRGNVASFTYDQLGRQVQVTHPAPEGQSPGRTVTEYDLAGEILASVDPMGARAEATYDDLGRAITQTQVERKPTAAAYTTTLTYNDASQLTKVITPGNKATTYSPNALGEVKSTVDAATNTTTQSFDLAGRTTKITDPSGNATQVDYDLAGRRITETNLNASGTILRTRSFGYDSAGNLTSNTSAEGRITKQTFDALNRVTALIEPVSATDSITTSFGYDAAGARTRLTDGRGNATWTSYNSLALPETVVEPATAAHPDSADRTWTQVYDQAANPVASLLPGGVRIDRTFDHLGRLTKESGSGGQSASAERTYGYDLAGHTITIGDVSVDYNDRGLPLTVSRGTSQQTAYTYDALGNPTQRVDATGTADFTWDNVNRIGTATDPVTGRKITYGYDKSSRLTSMGAAKGSTATDSQTFDYDATDRLTSHILRNGAGTQQAQITYEWDKDDNLTAKTTAGGRGPSGTGDPGELPLDPAPRMAAVAAAGTGKNTYTYDQAGRLTSWTAPDAKVTTYEWDAAGNRTKAGDKTFTYDERNRLLSGDGTDYAYTPRGTLATQTKAGVTTNLSFDAFDRLISDGDSLYTYDGLNRLSSRTRGTVKDQFIYTGLGNDIATITDAGTGGLRAKYGRDASGGLLGQQEGTGPATGTLTDLHDDLVATFDTTGLITSTSYDPFGNVTTQTGGKTNLGYQGEYTDPDTGRVNMHARWYQPGTGAFTTRDSATLNPNPSVQANRYSYANASPLVGNDPTGHWTEVTWDSEGRASSDGGYVCSGSICHETATHERWWSSFITSAGYDYNHSPEFSPEELKRIGGGYMSNGRPKPDGIDFSSMTPEHQRAFMQGWDPTMNRAELGMLAMMTMGASAGGSAGGRPSSCSEGNFGFAKKCVDTYKQLCSENPGTKACSKWLDKLTKDRPAWAKELNPKFFKAMLFMTYEMVTNLDHPVFKWAEEQKKKYGQVISTAALMNRIYKVFKAGARWDHKGYLRTLLGLGKPGHLKNDGYVCVYKDCKGGQVYYDVFSNIHFGWIMNALGFTREFTHWAADMYARKSSTVEDEGDQYAEYLGWRMFESWGNGAARNRENAKAYGVYDLWYDMRRLFEYYEEQEVEQYRW